MTCPFDKPTIESRLSVRGVKWHRDDPDIIPLWLADQDYPLCPEVKQALRDAVEEEYTVYSSDLEARECMSEKINRYNKLDVPTSQIMLTQGVIPGMWLAAKHATMPGDEIIITDPVYFPFITQTEVAKTHAVWWQLDVEDGYKFDIEKLKGLISPKTKLIYVCNPHNPAGRIMTKEELKGVADVAVDNGIYVMVDELWEDILNDGRKHISLAALSPEIADLTITSWGFSKSWSVPGLQAGYLAATNKVIFESLTKHAAGVLRGTNNMSDAITPIICSGKVDYWLKDMNKYLEDVRDLVVKRLNDMADVTIPHLEGTYLMFPKFNYGLSSDQLNEVFLKEAKVSLNKGSIFGELGNGHMRLLTATSKGIMNEALDRIEKVIPTLEKMKV
jgi:bifunctional pyridoxal-dependent enzyme with beta-cystathionase and maltose regulon repressor activities